MSWEQFQFPCLPRFTCTRTQYGFLSVPPTRRLSLVHLPTTTVQDTLWQPLFPSSSWMMLLRVGFKSATQPESFAVHFASTPAAELSLFLSWWRQTSVKPSTSVTVRPSIVVVLVAATCHKTGCVEQGHAIRH